MTQALELLRHGQHVRPAYAPLPGHNEGMAGKSTAEERPDGQASGILKRFKKHEEAGWNPQALGWIKATHRDAIEYTGLVDELEGFAMWGGTLGFVGVLFLCGFGVYMLVAKNSWFMLVFMALVGIPFGVYITTLSLRLTIYKPADLPILFDRKHRMVYRILREQDHGIKGLFKRWPIKACAYEWDLIDAEHETEFFTTGATVNRNHYLMFIVRQSVDDATIIDNFQIGNAMGMNEEIVANMWEHIRRFMEDNGPHLPSQDEPLAAKKQAPTWWEACGTVSVFGSRYKQRWREEPLRAVMAHLLFPILLPAGLIIGTGNWLAHKTAIHVEWPDEVKRAVGPVVNVAR
jgi:hypothetical protein